MNNHSFFVDRIEYLKHNENNIGFIFHGSKFEKPTPIKPLDVWEHNLETCKGCKENFDKVFFAKERQIKSFPNCCAQHKKLISQDWFNKRDFDNIPELYAQKLFYSWFHILHFLDKENWRKEVFDYLEYAISSFGCFPNGFGEPLYLSHYLDHLKHIIKQAQKDVRTTSISTLELNKRISELLAYLNKVKKADDSYIPTDLNILLNTYQKWLKIFPFEISFFAGLKPHFEKQIPILNGKPEINKYTGHAKSQLHTKGSLINVLQNLTKNLLDKVNVPELRKQGEITDIQGNQLEFAEAELNTKTAEITKQFSKGELKYVKALKKWLQLHKEYFKEVTPLLKALQPQTKNETPFSVLEWATIFYYADETKLLAESRTIKERIEQFINKYEIKTTLKYFRTQYYEAKKRINEKNDYPINKLELIIPFLREKYKQTVTKVENDIIFLKENRTEY